MTTMLTRKFLNFKFYVHRLSLNIIFPFTPSSSKYSLSMMSPRQNPVGTSPVPPNCYMTHPSHSSLFDHPRNIWWGQRIKSSKLCSLLHFFVNSSVVRSNILLSTFFTNTVTPYSSLSVTDPCKIISSIVAPPILFSMFLVRKLEDKIFCTEWYQTIPVSSLLLISSWFFTNVLKINRFHWLDHTLLISVTQLACNTSWLTTTSGYSSSPFSATHS